MGNKYWRFTEEEYNQELVRFIMERITYIDKNTDKVNYNEDKIKDLKKSIKKLYAMIDHIDDNDVWIMSDETKRFALKTIIIKDTHDWSDFSCDINANPRDIMFRFLLNEFYKDSFVSQCLESSNINFTHEMWKDVAYIKSGMFKFSEWDDEHVEAVFGARERAKDNGNYNPKEDPVLLKVYKPYQIKCDLLSKSEIPDHISENEEEYIKKHGIGVKVSEETIRAIGK